MKNEVISAARVCEVNVGGREDRDSLLSLVGD